MISFSRLCVLWALRMLCSELTEHKCCVSACEKCCKHPRGDHKKINGSGKSPLYLLLWVQQQSSQPIAAAWCSPANARERIVIQQHRPAGRQLIFKTATVRKPATLKLWKMSVLLSPDRMILFFFFFFLVARARVFSFGLSNCAQDFFSRTGLLSVSHPKAWHQFCCEMKFEPFLTLSAVWRAALHCLKGAVSTSQPLDSHPLQCLWAFLPKSRCFSFPELSWSDWNTRLCLWAADSLSSIKTSVPFWHLFIWFSAPSSVGFSLYSNPHFAFVTEKNGSFFPVRQGWWEF